MSTDFSIKPVGAPVATPIVQPVSEAANRRSRPNCRRARASRRRTRARACSIDSGTPSAHHVSQSGRDRSRRRLDRLSGGRQPDEPGGEAVSRGSRVAPPRLFPHARSEQGRADAPARHRPQGLGKPKSQLELRGVGCVEIGLPGRGIGDDVLDLCRSSAGQHEFGVADPERPVLDEDFLEFVGAVALVLNLGAKAGDVRDRKS